MYQSSTARRIRIWAHTCITYCIPHHHRHRHRHPSWVHHASALTPTSRVATVLAHPQHNTTTIDACQPVVASTSPQPQPHCIILKPRPRGSHTMHPSRTPSIGADWRRAYLRTVRRPTSVSIPVFVPYIFPVHSYFYLQSISHLYIFNIFISRSIYILPHPRPHLLRARYFLHLYISPRPSRYLALVLSLSLPLPLSLHLCLHFYRLLVPRVISWIGPDWQHLSLICRYDIVYVWIVWRPCTVVDSGSRVYIV